MPTYNILTKNSNGNTSVFKSNVTVKSDEEADKLVSNLEEKTGFDYEWEKVEEEDTEDTVETEDTEVEDTEVEEETSESEGDDEDVEVTEDTDEETETEDEVEVEVEVEYKEEEPQENYPRGWHRQNEFVAKDGTVYHKGEEQPEKYRTLEPSEY